MHAVPNDMEEFDRLSDALRAVEIELPQETVDRLDRYRELLWQTNDHLNLTRHTTLGLFVVRDLVDTLRFSELIGDGESVLDVGTGGGVPGVPLAIMRPEVDVSLCESVGKKAAAVSDFIADLGLPVPVHHARAEDLLTDLSFDVLVARAVAPLAKILRWFAPHWSHIGRLLIVKGNRWTEERGEARHLGLLKPLELRKASEYTTPYLGAENVILQVARARLN